MSQHEQNKTHHPKPREVVDAWDDMVLHVDPAGRVVRRSGAIPDYLPEFTGTGMPFWEVLGIEAQSLGQVLEDFPPIHVHRIPCDDGRSFLLRIIPVSADLDPDSGFLVVVTENLLVKALCDSYEERLEHNISAWSDSITLFNAFFDGVKDAAFLMDESGVILTANSAAINQCTRPGQDLGGQEVQILFGRRYGPKVKRAMKSLQPRQLWSDKVTALDGEGESFPVEATLRKIRLSEHSLFQLTLHDLSAQLELREDLRDQKAEVEKMNIALRQVIKSVEKDRRELRQQLTSQVKKQMLPALERIAQADAQEIREGYKSIIEERLVELAAPGGAGEVDADLLRLSPRELEVCQLIQMGRTGAEIAELLSMSFETVQTHRKNIRRKLGLRGRKVSLFTYLRQKPSLV